MPNLLLGVFASCSLVKYHRSSAAIYMYTQFTRDRVNDTHDSRDRVWIWASGEREFRRRALDISTTKLRSAVWCHVARSSDPKWRRSDARYRKHCRGEPSSYSRERGIFVMERIFSHKWRFFFFFFSFTPRDTYKRLVWTDENLEIAANLSRHCFPIVSPC